MSKSGSQCPYSGANTAIGSSATEQWWPDQLNLKILHQHHPKSDPMGEDFDYAKEFKTLDLARGEAGHHRGVDHVAGLVAGRLRPLRAAHDPDGLAQRRHLPRGRRPRRRRLRTPALRTAQQLARQPKPRQGPAAALAGQAEVRPEDLVGRPDDPDRQLRPGVDGTRRPSASRAGAATSGPPRRTPTGAPRRSGSATSATPASG